MKPQHQKNKYHHILLHLQFVTLNTVKTICQKKNKKLMSVAREVVYQDPQTQFITNKFLTVSLYQC
jgi:hypothetical protein